MEIKNSAWITVTQDTSDICPVFRKQFDAKKTIEKAELQITALGVYQVEINGRRAGDFVLAPGWTSYEHRLQVQTYDVTTLLQKDNDLRVTVGRGWFRSPMPGWLNSEDKQRRMAQPCGLIALLHLYYADGTEKTILTDETWQWAKSRVLFSEIYDGETCDARIEPSDWQPVQPLAWSKDILIPQEGEEIRETERVAAKSVFKTPQGDTVVDFGQEVTGYAEITLDAHAGDEVLFDHAEVQDKDGNWYNENYRSAKAQAKYICREGQQSWHPELTFFGFRYIRLLSWPGEAKAENFTAIAVHSDIRRTGWLKSGNAELNQLFSNIVWGQRGNFLDVPTDCPQRDERLGWTGDAEVFVRAASLNYDVERFFLKWLKDMTADRFPDGSVGSVIPNVLPGDRPSAAWGDAATICPWTIWQTYGNIEVLENQYDTMAGWVDAITGMTTTPNLWTGGTHFADWLGLDAPSGSYKGSTREDFIASAFYAHSTSLVIRAGRLLGRDVSRYEALYDAIVQAFRATFADYRTQTEHILAVRFGLAEDVQATADALADMVVRDGTQLRTGFVGTPHILHVLSEYGHADLAWSLLLREQYPSWLYPVSKGATTIWEHWDGIMEDGGFWSADMNSFNHYAYGSVIDWIYEVAAGIRHDEAHPGFSRAIVAPVPDARLGWLEASIDTRNGRISSKWSYGAEGVRAEIDTPVPATLVIDGRATEVGPGSYTLWGRA